MDAKLDIGRVFSQIFRIYGQQFALLIGGALAVFVPVAIINGLLYDSGGFFLTVIANAVALVAGYLYQGMVVEAARDILDGRRDQSIGGLFRSAGAVIGTLIVVGILAGIAIAIGFVLLIVPGLILITIWAVVVPVVVIERTGVLEAFGRSRELVRGNGWQVFGVLILLFIAAFIVQILIAAILGGIFDSVFGFALGILITSLLLSPLTALAASVIFFELKAIKGEPVLATGPGGVPTEPAGAPGAAGAAAGPGGGGPPAAPTTPERPPNPERPPTPDQPAAPEQASPTTPEQGTPPAPEQPPPPPETRRPGGTPPER
jgi:hypothetical protein